MGAADYHESPIPTFQKLDDKDELSTQFERSIILVREYTSRVEQDYARPLLKICYAYSQRRPISSVFLGFFALLSFLPLLSFIGISVLTTVVLTTIALGAAFIASTGIVLGLLAVLLAALTATFFTSVCLSSVAISAYLFLRFSILVRREGASGLSSWTGEIKGLVMGTQPTSPQQNGVKVIPEASVPVPEDTPSDSDFHPQETDKEIEATTENQ